MQHLNVYDVAIIGGGLAGLSLSIQLAQSGWRVILFEKETYPFHKVCGEYISMESWPFLQSLGIGLNAMNLPRINKLRVTAPDGSMFESKLPLGGFGISRYRLDKLLADVAMSAGVSLFQGCRVNDVKKEGETFLLNFTDQKDDACFIQARLCFGAYGKRSNLDIRWRRGFLNKQHKKLDNYVGIKYHVTGDGDQGLISLHNFEGGYCGISEIEDGKYCLCYMTKASNLKNSGNSIVRMEEEILYNNPHLRKTFLSYKRMESFPVTISQISFQQKTLTENGIIMLGDAAGMITPLCGNGMSMALYTSKILYQLSNQFLNGEIDHQLLIKKYERQWRDSFSSRMKTGRLLQRLFGKAITSNVMVRLFKTLPFLINPIIKKTHGKPF